jgi:hypothetical protein
VFVVPSRVYKWSINRIQTHSIVTPLKRDNMNEGRLVEDWKGSGTGKYYRVDRQEKRVKPRLGQPSSQAGIGIQHLHNAST